MGVLLLPLLTRPDYSGRCRSNFTFLDDGQPTARRRDGTVLFLGLECSVTLSGFSFDGLGQIVKS